MNCNNTIKIIFLVAMLCGIVAGEHSPQYGPPGCFENEFGWAPQSGDNINPDPWCGPSPANEGNTFDFIIVGSGAAGSVLANKLSGAGWEVLLIEAGIPSQRDLGGTDYVVNSFNTNATGGISLGTPFTRYDVPIFYKTLFTVPYIDENADWGVKGANVGKLIGGSHCHNGMAWVHPTEQNINTWNIVGWDYATFLGQIIAAENVTGSSLQGLPNHGTSGPIQISDAAFITSAEEMFLNITQSYGIPYNPDIDSSPRQGAGWTHFNIRRGVRDSAAHAFLLPALSRSNLYFLNPAQVTKVLISNCEGQNTAIGVQYMRTWNGVDYFFNVYVKKEVILSAGAILSPWLLMNSGIGPANQLNEFGIPIVVSNPNVGQHMFNNLAFNMLWNINEYFPPNFWDFDNQYIQYGVSGTGILATHGNSILAVFFKSNSSLVEADMLLALNLDGGNLVAQNMGIGLEVAQPVYANGTVTLQSGDPTVLPLYTANANINPIDIQKVITGIQTVRAIMAQPAAQAYFGTEISPGAQYSTAAELEPLVVAGLGTASHYAGTCKMGNTGDPLRVVDPELRVVGVNGLRVIDASITPSVVNAFMSATAVGIGMMGASLVLATYE